MLELNLPARRNLNILCLGAHSDDIEIGCGGTILALLQDVADVWVRWTIFSSNRARAAEARKSARLFLNGARGTKIEILRYRDGFLPYAGHAVKEEFEKLKAQFSPDLIFTHYREDRHQDHRLVSDLTWNTWRDHLILEYEIPKYDGDFGTPNFFVALQKKILDRKIEIVVGSFRSQQEKNWFESATFKGLARLRGIECNSPTRLAEAFFCRKAVFGGVAKPGLRF